MVSPRGELIKQRPLSGDPQISQIAQIVNSRDNGNGTADERR